MDSVLLEDSKVSFSRIHETISHNTIAILNHHRLDMDTSYLFWVPPLIVAAATLYVFYRGQTLRITENRLSQFYSPLYLYVVRGLPEDGEFWKNMTGPEKEDLLRRIITGNHLASEVLLEIILGGAFSNSAEAFNEAETRKNFQDQVIRDYEKLREDYTNAKHWFFPRIV